MVGDLKNRWQLLTLSSEWSVEPYLYDIYIYMYINLKETEPDEDDLELLGQPYYAVQ